MERRAVPPLLALIAGVWMALAAPAIAAPAEAEQAGDGATDAVRIRFFEERVRPVLQANCVKCHGGEKTKAGLRLTGRQGVLAGGDSGPAAVPEQAAESLLIEAIS